MTSVLKLIERPSYIKNETQWLYRSDLKSEVHSLYRLINTEGSTEVHALFEHIKVLSIILQYSINV